MDANDRCPHEEGTRAALMWTRGWDAYQGEKGPDQCPTSEDPDRNYWINGYTAAQLRNQMEEKSGRIF